MANDPLIGRLIRNKSILLEDFIGSGGMGRVYLGRDVILDRPVAVKILHPEYVNVPTAQAFIRSEARAASRLWHPNIIQIIELADEPKIGLCIVMEYAPGCTLADVIEKDFPLKTQRIVKILDQVLNALEVAHTEGIIHRDLKPENIMLHDIPGQPDFVKILDFGVAKHIENPSTHGAEQVLGTPHFMSPEQAQGKNTDGRSDLYSVGVMLFQIITRELPFDDTATPVTEKVIRYAPPMPSGMQMGKWVDKRLETICLKAMEKNPNDRYQTAAEFRNALDALVKSPTMRRNTLSVTSQEMSDENDSSDYGVYGVQFVKVVPLDKNAFDNGAADALYEIFENNIKFYRGRCVKIDATNFAAIFTPTNASGYTVWTAAESAENTGALYREHPGYKKSFEIYQGLTCDTMFTEGEIQKARMRRTWSEAKELADLAGPGEILIGQLFGTYLSPDMICRSADNRLKLIERSKKGDAILGPLPILGRKAVLRTLTYSVERLLQNDASQKVLISAPQSYGKTCLLGFYTSLAERLGVKVFFVRSYPHYSYEPAYALRDLYRQFKDEYAEIIAEKANIIWAHATEVLESLLLDGTAPETMKEQWIGALTMAFCGILRYIPTPFVIAADNFDNLDPVSFATLDSIIKNLPNQCVFIAAARDTNNVLESFGENLLHIELNPIEDSIIRQYLHEHIDNLTDSTLSHYVKIIEGNPEYLRATLDFFNHHPRLTPNNAGQLYSAQLDNLPELARRVLSLASCLGPFVPLNILFTACPKSWNFEQCLRILEKKNILLVGQIHGKQCLVFQSSKLCAVANAQLSAQARANMNYRLSLCYPENPAFNRLKKAVLLFKAAQWQAGFEHLVPAYYGMAEKYGTDATLPVIDILFHYAKYPQFALFNPIFYVYATLNLIYLQRFADAQRILSCYTMDKNSDAQMNKYAAETLIRACLDQASVSPEKIEQCLRQDIDSPLDALLLYQLALKYKNNLQFADAVFLLEKINDIGPDPRISPLVEELLRNIESEKAQCLISAGEDEKGLALFKRLAQGSMGSYAAIQASLQLAKYYQKNKDLSASFGHFKNAYAMALKSADFNIVIRCLLYGASLSANPPANALNFLRNAEQYAKILSIRGFDDEISRIKEKIQYEDP